MYAHNTELGKIQHPFIILKTHTSQQAKNKRKILDKKTAPSQCGLVVEH